MSLLLKVRFQEEWPNFPFQPALDDSAAHITRRSTSADFLIDFIVYHFT